MVAYEDIIDSLKDQIADLILERTVLELKLEGAMEAVVELTQKSEEQQEVLNRLKLQKEVEETT